MSQKNKHHSEQSKVEDLEKNKVSHEDQPLTSNQGLKITDDQHSLKAGERGPSLLEDFYLREKITHFDHERIPERVVHARGSAAHGYFELTSSLSEYSKAGFLQKEGTRTPVFTRFSTVAGSKGSTDLARDVRGFSVKFYTQEGIYDLVGNNIPVFFIQDAVKFPDLIHAVKPEPHNEIPQAASAHDTFWDFVSVMPESMHMIMWTMSDRAIPRSYSRMEGFGVHTFRLVNEAGKSFFVKFHWKPVLGVHSVVWEEAQMISGADPDFHRRDLWQSIEDGNYPEWHLGVQIVEEEREHDFDFDLLDPTKIIPEEEVPVRIIGRMVLDRNPDNFFAETEQVAFHPGHLVPGIDFSNDPLLQGRLFSYTDTQLIRLGGPNFHEIPINRPTVPVRNNQRDGYMRQTIDKGQTSYHPNRLGGGCPFQSKMSEGGFTSYHERIDGHKIRNRSKSFFDHFSQAALFYRSQSKVEKTHIENALKFELGKVKSVEVQKRVVAMLAEVDKGLAEGIAEGLGLHLAEIAVDQFNHSIPADANPEDFQPQKKKVGLEKSEALSMENTKKDSIQGRRVAFLIHEGTSANSLDKMKEAIEKEKANVFLIAPKLGSFKLGNSKNYGIDHTYQTAMSVLFDAVFVPEGEVKGHPKSAKLFIEEAFRHCKPIGGEGHAGNLIEEAIKIHNMEINQTPGLFIETTPKAFIDGIAQHRFWDREEMIQG
ncbi:catalase [Pleomorphovibrio marinus]|uniref:catalase n=1 Tax=Pleomorphovibrio marinus TaxID=2164132 RepID=UPI000E0C47C4|nr:catalase [Pleomorphovibrio marinus]